LGENTAKVVVLPPWKGVNGLFALRPSCAWGPCESHVQALLTGRNLEKNNKKLVDSKQMF
jgi:hypothetical protein